MKITTVLFDLDGTLTDSGPGIMNSVKYALEKVGEPTPDVDELRKFIGPPLKVSLWNTVELMKKKQQRWLLFIENISQ